MKTSTQDQLQEIGRLSMAILRSYIFDIKFWFLRRKLHKLFDEMGVPK